MENSHVFIISDIYYLSQHNIDKVNCLNVSFFSLGLIAISFNNSKQRSIYSLEEHYYILSKKKEHYY